MAGIDVGIFPLMKKPELIKAAKDIKADLEKEFIVEYDEGGSIGRRYLRGALKGIPYAITIDFDSLKNEDVTIRDRDSEKQIRVGIKDLRRIIGGLLKGEIGFGEV